ncbi:MAG: hypothetical protein Q8K60_06360 [Parachlamydiaceae bacterium]|nr:hypothetical protein [Parachlamydiaceae bacterium]
MKIIQSAFHFLGGIYFAITLITCTACLVIIGTFLESYTESHQFAAQWIYSSPLLMLLLILFFVNILFSALRRWPFKQRHIPFLLTHLGLLMIISGTMIKNFWGIQGHLPVWEGSGNQQLLFPQTYALGIEKNEGLNHKNPVEILALNQLKRNRFFPEKFNDLNFKIIGFTPHSKPKYETWFKNNQLSIRGIPPITAENWEIGKPFPRGILIPLKMNNPQLWNVIALSNPTSNNLLSAIYLNNLSIKIIDKKDPTIFLQLSLKNALENSIDFAGGQWTTILHLADEKNSSVPYLEFVFRNQQNHFEDHFQLPLQGENALLLSSQSKWKEAPVTIDLQRDNPLLCFIDEVEKNRLLACDQHGRFYEESFNLQQLETLYSYDHGFGGYSVQTILPFLSIPSGRQEKEIASCWILKKNLRDAFLKESHLTPPLVLLKKASEKSQQDLAEIFVQFLYEWDKTSSFLFDSDQSLSEPLKRTLKNINWNEVTPTDFSASQWLVQMFIQLEEAYQSGVHYLDSLKKNRWPYAKELEKKIKDKNLISAPNLLANQLLSIIDYFPPLENKSRNLPVQQSAVLLSALFRAYEIDLRSLKLTQEDPQENFDHLITYFKENFNNSEIDTDQKIILETPLTLKIIPEDPLKKLEDCCPGILLEVTDTKKNLKEKIALPYDSTMSGFKWPIFNGIYALRFQPQVYTIPYRIRLREARQIPYPNTQQIYSYEGDILISHENQKPLSHTLSMNQVYETWDGYRFYLSGIGTSDEYGIKRVQLIVNRDPAKYFLTYPGAMFVFMGIILLFWLRPYGRK